MALLILKILLALYALQGFIKPLLHFIVKKERRMKMAEAMYAKKEGKADVSRLTDGMLYLFCLILLGLLASSGIEYLNFTTGFLVGLTALQLYFHAFNQPLEKQPAPPLTPIKMMSYAIKEMPGKAWVSTLFMSAILFWCLVMIILNVI
ncbi:hypothetical protein [Ktedonospora formicarum]|uniref:Uncharacterized protein n=1 Tax=Ktedonospora formicarum TaxID=2778364 RepID=A0A8J3ICB6_9CHLR|nr:hypothetical protein [Ktedonospora formicarum]GHO48774.1 hypothetical protein KSX_69370 [Ktedonospora formicarum]